jgi:hypothetical protein
MPNINFQAVLDTLTKGIGDLAKTTVSGFVKQAEADGQDFLDSSKADLQKWTTALATGQLAKEDFISLVAGQKDLLTMTALKQAGLSAIALDNFKAGVFDLIEKTVFALI